jgi:hypothetical protein
MQGAMRPRIVSPTIQRGATVFNRRGAKLTLLAVA